ncbi:uncharacterized protein LOC117905110 [Vitis riparia]|uniref:uncharacterized protein LOC117905110 n=1 Tax=Vitis riparia TaxID=96939 RepID=UPI00155AAFAD|nr:uncharacterized protein LOC117905110 [Vitis riparia]
MGRARTRLPSLCVSRAMARVRVRSWTPWSKPTSNSIRRGGKNEFSGNGMGKSFSSNVEMGWCGGGNRIMVVVDSSIEAKGALEWALSHAVQPQDTLLLFHVTKSTRSGVDSSRDLNQKAYQLLQSMKNMSQMKKPGVQVEIALQQGKEKGPTIVEEAKQQRVSLLILGKRKQSSMVWCGLVKWATDRICRGVVDYCIQNADCMTVAVRRKGKKLGGYLITTKNHKDFWLLA